jgi:hypothetical protein
LEGETVESDEEEDLEEQHDEQESDVEAPLRSINGRERKRRKDGGFEPRENPQKRARLDHDDGTDSVSASHQTSVFGTSQFSVKRIGSLGCRRPNPMNLARSTWLPNSYHEHDATSDTETDSSRVPDDGAARPLMINSNPADTENWRKSFSRGPIPADDEDLPMSPVGALTFKPSPGNYAKRRWSSEVWASNATRDSSHSDLSDREETSPDYSDDEHSIDINVDYKKRFSIYYITQRENADTDDGSSSGEEVRFDHVPSVPDTDV